jgi:hypothetical protein
MCSFNKIYKQLKIYYQVLTGHCGTIRCEQRIRQPIDRVK